MGWTGMGCRGELRPEDGNERRQPSYVKSPTVVQPTWDTTRPSTRSKNPVVSECRRHGRHPGLKTLASKRAWPGVSQQSSPVPGHKRGPTVVNGIRLKV